MKKLLIIALILSSVAVFPCVPVDRDEKRCRSFVDRHRYDEKSLQTVLDNFLKRKESVIQKRRTLPYVLAAGGALCLVLSAGCYCNMVDVTFDEWAREKDKRTMILFASVGMGTLALAYHWASNLDADESELRRKLNRRESIIRERLEEAKKRSKV